MYECVGQLYSDPSSVGSAGYWALTVPPLATQREYVPKYRHCRWSALEQSCRDVSLPSIAEPQASRMVETSRAVASRGRDGGVAGQVARRMLPGIEFGFRPIRIGGVLALLGSTAPGFDSPRQLPSHLRRYHLLASPSPTSSTALVHLCTYPHSSTRPLSPILGASSPRLVPPGPPTHYSQFARIFSIYVPVETFSVFYLHSVSAQLSR